MKAPSVSFPMWAIVPVIMILETAVFAVLAAAALDSLLHRPEVGGGSVTTLLPGFAYACATVMKVCLLGALVAGVVGLAWRLLLGRAPMALRSRPPVWGIASIVLAPSTLLFGTIAVLVAQGIVASPEPLSAGHFYHVSRTGVFVMLSVLTAGMVAAVISWLRREQPGIFSLMGVVANIVLAGLFWYLKFYAVGFDQDKWAPR